jgi:hypothetical protein
MTTVAVVGAYISCAGSVAVLLGFVIRLLVFRTYLRVIAWELFVRFIRGQNVFWDDLVEKYSVSTPGQGSLILAQVSRFAESFSGIDVVLVKRLIRNAKRSVPRHDCNSGTSLCLGTLCLPHIFVMFLIRSALDAPSWFVAIPVVVATVLSLIFVLFCVDCIYFAAKVLLLRRKMKATFT